LVTGDDFFGGSMQNWRGEGVSKVSPLFVCESLSP